jgi:small subunit ribosomal protein S1
VTSLTEFGAFVQLEPGVEGLIHQSEFSWKERWAKPKDYLKLGQTVDSRVISVDRAEEKISLSFKRAGPNPWEEAVKKFPVGSRVKGVVTHLVPFGAFVRLPTEIEGLLHVEDLSWTRQVSHPKDYVKVGQELELVVLEVNPKEERVSLGFKQLTEDPFVKWKVGSAVEGTVKSLLDRGAIVELAPDVEAYLPAGEISSEEKDRDRDKPARASDLLKEGQKVTASVTKLQRKGKSIEISIRKYDRQEERKLLKQYRASGDGPTLAEITEWEEPSRGDASKP